METKELRHYLYTEYKRAEAEHSLCDKNNEFRSGETYGEATAYRLILDHIPYDHQENRDPFGFPNRPTTLNTGNAMVQALVQFSSSILGAKAAADFFEDGNKGFSTIVSFVEGLGYRVQGKYRKYSTMNSDDCQLPYSDITEQNPQLISEQSIAEFGFCQYEVVKYENYTHTKYKLIKPHVPAEDAQRLTYDEWVKLHTYPKVKLIVSCDQTLRRIYTLSISYIDDDLHTFEGEVETMYELLTALRLCRVPLPRN